MSQSLKISEKKPVMPSPRITRAANATNPSGRIEFMSLLTSKTGFTEPVATRHRLSDSPVHRKDSFNSNSPASQQLLPEEDCMKLNPSFLGIALRSLLAVDLWLTKKLGVCAREGSSWGSARPMMKLVEISGHGIPWIGGTMYYLFKSDSYARREVILNLLFALLLDIILVAIVKGIVKRPRPLQNRMDMFATFSVDKYSFPSGHATRAAMVARFMLKHLVLAMPVRVLVVLWAIVVSMSRVMLGRHNVTDVAFGFFMGHMQYSLVEYLWLSPNTLQSVFRV